MNKNFFCETDTIYAFAKKSLTQLNLIQHKQFVRKRSHFAWEQSTFTPVFKETLSKKLRIFNPMTILHHLFNDEMIRVISRSKLDNQQEHLSNSKEMQCTKRDRTP